MSDATIVPQGDVVADMARSEDQYHPYCPGHIGSEL